MPIQRHTKPGNRNAPHTLILMRNFVRRRPSQTSVLKRKRNKGSCALLQVPPSPSAAAGRGTRQQGQVLLVWSQGTMQAEWNKWLHGKRWHLDSPLSNSSWQTGHSLFSPCACVCVWGGGGAGVNTRSHLRKNEVRRKHT